MIERCFACGKRLGTSPIMVDTRDAQTVYVGRDCGRKVMQAGDGGYQPPRGGPRLYPLAPNEVRHAE
jgi:hypothetical protein